MTLPAQRQAGLGVVKRGLNAGSIGIHINYREAILRCYDPTAKAVCNQSNFAVRVIPFAVSMVLDELFMKPGL